ncbi:hypothetical protein GOBAR_AA01527 [Gossypium barbadense]|uniref:RNase H type-1 domain-containing protein n=1 Tax=Gossypium barbadense TaxID=3634 RepID=A0A2P5YTX0_GOSBA|nr:hypothetical protein GOBAR_AA01527 [Gossypium barbadense]
MKGFLLPEHTAEEVLTTVKQIVPSLDCIWENVKRRRTTQPSLLWVLPPSTQPWTPSSMAFYKANFDKAFNQTKRKKEVKFVVRHAQREALATLGPKTTNCFMIEAKVVEEIEFYRNLGLRNVVFKGDSLGVIKGL